MTVQCLWCHCIHAAYRYDAPAPPLYSPWRKTLCLTQKQIYKNAHKDYNTHILKYKHLKRQMTLILIKQAGSKQSTHVSWVFQSDIFWDSLQSIHCPINLNRTINTTYLTSTHTTERQTHTQLYSLSLQLCYLCIQFLSTSLQLCHLLFRAKFSNLCYLKLSSAKQTTTMIL